MNRKQSPKNKQIDNSQLPSNNYVTTETNEFKEEKQTTPDGWTEYMNDRYGFSFAYPKEIGQLTSRTIENSQNILAYLSVESKPDSLTPSSGGLMIVMISSIDGYVESAAKYGPRLEYSDNKWIVSAKDYGDINNGGYEIGSVYDVEVLKEINGHKVYDFSYGDEGCESTNWVFKTSEAFVRIKLPSICGNDSETTLTPPTEKTKEAYKAKSAEILDTLLIY